ncbi:helix-turn-helix transcriptional regulator [uncultured Allobaculum sp.]|uniref:helix-turn-helix domain-containing protein n=2 Tax=Allobaculum TaxID=174708 RepID=UPI00338FBE07
MNLFKDARTKTRSFFIGALIKASRKICGPFNGSHGRCAFSKKNQLNTGPLRMRFLEGSASQRDASQLMGRKSLRSQKSIYQKSREKAGLTRKQASEKIVYLSENQLEKMERNKSAIDPRDVLAMEEAYGDYTLSSCHCAMHCAIGQKYDKAVELYSLAQIIVHAELAYTQLEGDRQRLLQLGAAKSITAEEAEFLKESSQRMKDLGQAGRELELWLKMKPIQSAEE